MAGGGEVKRSSFLMEAIWPGKAVEDYQVKINILGRSEERRVGK